MQGGKTMWGKHLLVHTRLLFNRVRDSQEVLR